MRKTILTAVSFAATLGLSAPVLANPATPTTHPAGDHEKDAPKKDGHHEEGHGGDHHDDKKHDPAHH